MLWSILVVDDEVEYAKILKRSLESDDRYIVSTAHNGLEALDIIDKEAMDMMILDLTMPVMDGIQLLTELHNRNIWLPVLILTGKRIDERDKPYQDFGIVEFMNKPANMDELRIKLKKILDARANRDVIHGLSLTTMLQVLEMERKTGVLTINLGEKDGRIFFKNGIIADIEVKGLTPKQAMQECLKFDNSERQISIEYVEHRKENRINKSLTEILLDSTRIADEEQQGI